MRCPFVELMIPSKRLWGSEDGASIRRRRLCSAADLASQHLKEFN